MDSEHRGPVFVGYFPHDGVAQYTSVVYQNIGTRPGRIDRLKGICDRLTVGNVANYELNWTDPTSVIDQRQGIPIGVENAYASASAVEKMGNGKPDSLRCAGHGNRFSRKIV